MNIIKYINAVYKGFLILPEQVFLNRGGQNSIKIKIIINVP